jgi:hypothetical protein
MSAKRKAFPSDLAGQVEASVKAVLDRNMPAIRRCKQSFNLVRFWVMEGARWALTKR